ncbi:hypothetical protein C3L33_20957, partial [Rhododendron williamsianum]
MASTMFSLSFLVILTSLTGTQAVEYTVTNNAAITPGGMRFANQIGIEYSKQTMSSATEFIWKTFQQTSNADRKDVPKVSLYIDSMAGVAYTNTINNEIHFSANYIQLYIGNVKTEFTGVMYHEMTHVWQWYGNGQPTPPGLIEGIADFIRLKAGYALSTWVKPGQGFRWDQGYDVTARFLDYCEGLRSGFVAELNKKLRTGYSEYYFVELLGKTVDQLWSDYKAKYNTN